MAAKVSWMDFWLAVIGEASVESYHRWVTNNEQLEARVVALEKAVAELRVVLDKMDASSQAGRPAESPRVTSRTPTRTGYAKR